MTSGGCRIFGCPQCASWASSPSISPRYSPCFRNCDQRTVPKSKNEQNKNIGQHLCLHLLESFISPEDSFEIQSTACNKWVLTSSISMIDLVDVSSMRSGAVPFGCRSVVSLRRHGARMGWRSSMIAVIVAGIVLVVSHRHGASDSIRRIIHPHGIHPDDVVPKTLQNQHSKTLFKKCLFHHSTLST